MWAARATRPAEVATTHRLEVVMSPRPLMEVQAGAGEQVAMTEVAGAATIMGRRLSSGRISRNRFDLGLRSKRSAYSQMRAAIHYTTANL